MAGDRDEGRTKAVELVVGPLALKKPRHALSSSLVGDPTQYLSTLHEPSLERPRLTSQVRTRLTWATLVSYLRNLPDAQNRRFGPLQPKGSDGR